MAILSVTGPLGPGMTISESLMDGSTASLQFRVVSDNPNESPAEVMNATGVPVLGVAFPGAPDVLLHQKSPSRQAADASNMVWLVNCDYKSILSKDERDRMGNKNPLDRKTSIIWKSREIMKLYRASIKRSDFYRNYTTAIESTFKPRSATNSASDPFEPILEYPTVEHFAVITKNVTQFPDWLLTYQNAVNDADFTITAYGKTTTINKGCAKIGLIQLPLSKQENGKEYIPLTFEINVRAPRELRTGLTPSPDETHAPEPFDDEIPDMGMRRRIVSADKGSKLSPNGNELIEDKHIGLWMNILDANNMGVTLPVPFDSLGKALNESIGAGYAIAEGRLWYSLVAPFKRKSFAILADYLK